MPIKSPVHPRTMELCKSLRWKNWAGYHAVCSYDLHPDGEYFALRHGAGIIDVTPLFKYDVKGADAAAFLSRMLVRSVERMEIGRVTYTCWCDDQGFIIDDGTVSRLGEDWFRVTAAEPTFGWMQRLSRGFEVEIVDITSTLAAFSIQGPSSKELLDAVFSGTASKLKYFRITSLPWRNTTVWLSRTGYTGDLGYEVWVESEHALALYDEILEVGQSYRLRPVGLDAMDTTRIEAGFIMNGVDYYSAHHCMIDARKNTPYELGLGWMVQLDRPAFIGQKALQAMSRQEPERKLVGVVMNWPELEELYASYGLPPELCTHAWRDGRPVYDLAGNWIGQATSGSWSPHLKQNLTLAQLMLPYTEESMKVKLEVTVEYRRHTVTGTVTKLPFFNPERKKL